MVETIAAFLLVVGAWGIFRSIRALVRGHRSHRWPVAPGEVRKVEVFRKSVRGGREVFRQKLEYTYTVGEVRYRRTRIRFGVPGRFDWRPKPLFQRGDRVEVVHHPTNHALSALERGYSPFGFITLLGAGWIFWQGVRMLVTWQ